MLILKIIEFLKGNKKYMEEFVARYTYHSNAIEGSTLTYAETYAILFNDNSFKINNKEPREIYEAIIHKRAMAILFDKLESKDCILTEQFIKRLNQTIN